MTARVNKITRDIVIKNHRLLSTAQAKPKMVGMANRPKPVVASLFIFKKPRLRPNKQLTTKAVASSWYKPILKEVKLYIGIPKEGYLDKGANKISRANNQNLIFFCVLILSITSNIIPVLLAVSQFPKLVLCGNIKLRTNYKHEN